MQVTLSKKEVQEMLLCLQGTLESGKNLPYKWKYALSKNIDKLDSEVKTIEKLRKPTPLFLKYNEKRLKLAEQFSDKDENGSPIFIEPTPQEMQLGISRRYKITKTEEFNKKLETLRTCEEYAAVVKEFDHSNSNEFMDETQEYDLHEIKVNKEEQEKLEKSEIVIPGASFRFTIKIMNEVPELAVV